MSRARGIFATACVVDVDSYSEQLTAVLTHYRELRRQIQNECGRSKNQSLDRQERWHRACLKVLGPKYFSIVNQEQSAVGL